jgi:hypothetical protein
MWLHRNEASQALTSTKGGLNEAALQLTSVSHVGQLQKSNSLPQDLRLLQNPGSLFSSGRLSCEPWNISRDELSALASSNHLQLGQQDTLPEALSMASRLDIKNGLNLQSHEPMAVCECCKRVVLPYELCNPGSVASDGSSTAPLSQSEDEGDQDLFKDKCPCCSQVWNSEHLASTTDTAFSNCDHQNIASSDEPCPTSYPPIYYKSALTTSVFYLMSDSDIRSLASTSVARHASWCEVARLRRHLDLTGGWLGDWFFSARVQLTFLPNQQKSVYQCLCCDTQYCY